MATAAKIPVIDISDDANQLQVAKDLVEAAIEHGFIYIKNTGKDIPVDAVENAFNTVRLLITGHQVFLCLTSH
jgi:isopenicillin N synthase-like dioxygenase